MSVNDPRGPSIDTCITKAKAKSKARAGAPAQERLAHRGCNTGKGATDPVVPWADHLFVVDPAPILATVDRLERKGGREAMARCPTRTDAEDAADLARRAASRDCARTSHVTAEIEPGGGQFLLALRA